ncbi:MAG: glycosyltransferase, partial [Lachnospiraceae bacterium]|nr:glycosyltransferase [Lachnospiraceae bacterium]
MFFTIIYLTWRTFFTIPLEYGLISTIAGISLLVVEALGMVEALIHYMNMYSVENYPLPQVPEELYPEVDVFIATYSEDVKLLYKTVNGCLHMEYPDKEKVHIYLCDDNRRTEIREMASKMGINYLDRPDNRGAKAGNLNNALAHSNSPLIVTFDADMIPKHDFLMKMIPYFVDNDIKNRGRKKEEKIKLGFVQSPQCFYNPDLFQFNLFSEGRIPNEQDYFYKDIQVARTKSNSVIYGGSNTVLRREALEDIGGFFTGAITEDFATGILMEKKGYVSLGIGEPLASGLSPTSLQELIQQRIRWGRGVIATGKKMHIYTSSDLSLSQKMNYWASIWYWYAPIKRLIYILSPILYATFGFMVLKCTLLEVLLFWLPMYISSNISLRILSGNIRSTKWTGIYETVLFPFMFIPIIMETFGITLNKFK